VGHGSIHRAAKLPKQPLTKREAAAARREKLHGTYGHRCPDEEKHRSPKEEAKYGEISRLLFGRSRMEMRGRRLASPVQRWMVTLEEDLTCSDEKPVRAMQWLHILPPP